MVLFARELSVLLELQLQGCLRKVDVVIYGVGIEYGCIRFQICDLVIERGMLLLSIEKNRFWWEF